jgi:hypothetical protein
MSDKPVQKIVWKGPWKETGQHTPVIRPVVGETGNGQFRPGCQGLYEEHGPRGVSFQGMATEWHERLYPQEVQARYHAWGTVNRILETRGTPEMSAEQRAKAAIWEMTHAAEASWPIPANGRGPER